MIGSHASVEGTFVFSPGGQRGASTPQGSSVYVTGDSGHVYLMLESDRGHFEDFGAAILCNADLHSKHRSAFFAAIDSDVAYGAPNQRCMILNYLHDTVAGPDGEEKWPLEGEVQCTLGIWGSVVAGIGYVKLLGYVNGHATDPSSAYGCGVLEFAHSSGLTSFRKLYWTYGSSNRNGFVSNMYDNVITSGLGALDQKLVDVFWNIFPDP